MGKLNQLAIVAAGLVVMTTVAHAGLQTNGLQTNGILWANGLQTNGLQTNGLQTNGLQTNGLQTNGLQTNGLQTNGLTLANVTVVNTQLQGSFIGSPSSTMAYTCAHREDQQGAALPSTCGPCAQTVVAADSYCGQYWWDAQCTLEAVQLCKATVTTGSRLTATLSNGTTRQLTIGTRTQGGWTWNGAQWVDNSDVWAQNVSWVLPHAPSVVGEKLAAGQFGNACVRTVCAADSYCCNNAWDGQCVNEATSMCTTKGNYIARTSTVGDSVCGYDANTGTARQAMFVGGTWNMSSGYQGAGGKNPAAPGAFTLACRAVGAIAKCVDMGYKPWLNPQQDTYHQACVRMVRADYCGDGTPWTVDGTTINVTDYFGTQPDTENWMMEATWSPKGARYLWTARLSYMGLLSNFSNHMSTHPYCQYNQSTGWGWELTDPYYANWDAAHTLNASVNMLRSEANLSCDGPDCPP